ncbi:MAG: four helix bundle suffix domain-containing protein [Planctomycetota bacterium]
MTRIRPSGGYRELRSFQIATLIYDATYCFCERFVDPRSRTSDQMIQAARSGRQNIAEGSRASATSSHTELRLVNVARASLEELLLDCEDYLRHRRLPQWAPDSPRALEVRNVGRGPEDRSDQTHPTDPPDLAATRIADDRRYARYARWLDDECPEIRANAIICLIHQANYLLDRQIEALERQFVEEGGYSEQLATARMAERAKQKQVRSDPTKQSDPTDPIPRCPQCHALMALRTAKSGPNAGQQFWGCTRYPECKGTARL